MLYNDAHRIEFSTCLYTNHDSKSIYNRWFSTKNIIGFCQNIISFGQNIKWSKYYRFWSNIKGFDKNIIVIGQKIKGFVQNIKVFDYNIKDFVQNMHRLKKLLF